MSTAVGGELRWSDSDSYRSPYPNSDADPNGDANTYFIA
jgi:hypothetical protein